MSLIIMLTILFPLLPQSMLIVDVGLLCCIKNSEINSTTVAEKQRHYRRRI